MILPEHAEMAGQGCMVRCSIIVVDFAGAA